MSEALEPRRGNLPVAPGERRQQLGLRAQPGLLLSIGERDERGLPQKLSHFRAKPGADGQYQQLAAKFHDAFGDAPQHVEITPPTNEFGDMLDIRWKAFAGGGDGSAGYLRAIGDANFAERGVLGGNDVITLWNPDGSVEEHAIKGDDDRLLLELGAKRITTLRFLIPKVTGLTTWAEISTASRVSTDNLWRKLVQLHGLAGGKVFGLHVTLWLRRATSRPIVVKDGESKRIRSSFWALDLATPYTVEDFQRQMNELQGLAPLALPPSDPKAALGDVAIADVDHSPVRTRKQLHGALHSLRPAEVSKGDWDAFTKGICHELFGHPKRSDLSTEQMDRLTYEVERQLEGDGAVISADGAEQAGEPASYAAGSPAESEPDERFVDEDIVDQDDTPF